MKTFLSPSFAAAPELQPIKILRHVSASTAAPAPLPAIKLSCAFGDHPARPVKQEPSPQNLVASKIPPDAVAVAIPARVTLPAPAEALISIVPTA